MDASLVAGLYLIQVLVDLDDGLECGFDSLILSGLVRTVIGIPTVGHQGVAVLVVLREVRHEGLLAQDHCGGERKFAKHFFSFNYN